MPKLKSCPNCRKNGKNAVVNRIVCSGSIFDSHLFFIECPSCHWCGKTKLFLWRAKRAWNKYKQKGDNVRKEKKKKMSLLEFWLPVKDHPKYEVSNLGRVRNKGTGRILKMHLNYPNGYLRVSLDGKHYYVHRLVADAFYDGDHSGMDVNHIDGNKNNNMLGNLEWCTRRYNIQHAFDNGLKYQNTLKVVRCAFCSRRYEYDFCFDKPDSFYCAYGSRQR